MRQRLAVAAVIVVAVLAAGLTKVADLDFWWHLKTGELIVRDHAIPRTDVYSFTAFGREYIDHEWLFQVIAFAAFRGGGVAAVAILKCVLIIATLLLVAFYVMHRGVPPPVAAGLVLLSVAGGITRFIERPELFSTLFGAMTFIIADTYLRDRDWRLLAVLPVICAVWANLHAAVVVGLVIQVLMIRALPQVVAVIASAAASCLNPFTTRVLTVPFELTRIIESGVVNNEEWRAPTFAKVPFYFVALAVAAILVAYGLAREWRRETRALLAAHVLVAAFLAYVSLRYIRNVALFCVFVPLVAQSGAARLSRFWQLLAAAAGGVSALIALTLYFPFQRGLGVASYFPQRLAHVVREKNLRGPMMNSYGFGGYLIWTLYPERRVFIDGRNEVYLPLLERLKASRGNSRAWAALMRDYRIEYAVIEYVDELDRVTMIDTAGRAHSAFAPVSTTRFPRSEWALIEWDDTGMIYVKRNGANAVVREYDSVFPEGHGYMRQLADAGLINRARAIMQLEQKLVEDSHCTRARTLLAQLAQNR